MQNLPVAFIEKLKDFLGEPQLLLDLTERQAYCSDNSRYQALPDAVILAETHENVVKIIQLCDAYNIPITARGRGTNTTGAAIPLHGGLVLSLERMQTILAIDPANRMLTAEAGVINQSVQDHAQKHGFFWAPDPSSSGCSTIGGNIACNAGGPRAIKYGACRENVLALKAVTATGKTIQTGFCTSKYAVGYDLTRLLIGSEGTLAIITEATLKLTPLPSATFTYALFFFSQFDAIAAVQQLLQMPETPHTLEFMDSDCLKRLKPLAQLQVPPDANALLLLEMTGAESQLLYYRAMIGNALKSTPLLQMQAAETAEEKETLWQIRKSLSPALKLIATMKINEDVVVPISKISDLINFIEELRNRYQLIIVVFGHAGNGNLHVNLMFNPEEPGKSDAAQACLNALFEKVIALNGTLSGEHGVGIEKKPFLSKIFDNNTLTLMKNIKTTFDPKGILNPGKLWD